LIVLFLCFVLENAGLLFALIAVAGVLGSFAYSHSVYTFFPLLMHLWFVKQLRKKESRELFYLPYFISLGAAGICGIILIAMGNSPDKNRTVPQVIFIAVVLLSLAFLVYLAARFGQNSAQKNAAKTGKKAKKKSSQPSHLETNAVIFYFLIVVFSVLDVINVMQGDWSAAFTKGLVFLGVAITAYAVVNVAFITRNKDASELLEPLRRLFG